MRMSKMLIPAVTLAGALALAGCGGGGSAPGISDERRTADTAISMAIDAAKALDVTADDVAAKVAAADALLEAAETAIAALPAGSGRDALEAMLEDADKIVDLAESYLAAQGRALAAQGRAMKADEEAKAAVAAKEEAEEAEKAAEAARMAAVNQAGTDAAARKAAEAAKDKAEMAQREAEAAKDKAEMAQREAEAAKDKADDEIARLEKQIEDAEEAAEEATEAADNAAKAIRAKALKSALANIGRNAAGTTDTTNPAGGDATGTGRISITASPQDLANMEKGASLKASSIDGYEYSGENLEGAVFSIGKTEEDADITDLSDGVNSNALAGTLGIPATVVWSADLKRVNIAGAVNSEEITGFGNGRTTHNNADSVQGNFFGVPGRYLCVSSDGCIVIKSRSTGSTSLAATEWHFAPSAGASAKISTAVAANLRFGWWIAENADEELQSFTLFLNGRGGTDGYAPRSESPADKATYKGGAAGQYASDSDDSSDHGDFTASVELTAEFDSTTYTDSMVSGTIDDFYVGGEARADWEVKLAKQSIGTANATANTLYNTDGNISWNDGDTKIADDGGYFVLGYGGVNASDNSADVPSALGGIFRVHNDDASLAGAFGAELE